MVLKVGALVCILCFGFTAAARAQDVAATSGFSAQGSAVAQALFGGMSINVGADIGLLSRGQQFRIDVSRLSMPGTDATMNALIQQFLPQGSFTVVFDRAAHTLTLWSTDRRKYYVMTGSATSTPTPVMIVTSGSLTQGLQFLKTLKDYAVYDMQANLSGHSTVNGHPATMFHYSAHEQKRGGSLSTMSGDVAFADDQQGLPLQVTSALVGRNFHGSFRLDFRQLSASAPDASSFAVPEGFTKANDLSEIFGNLSSAIPH